MAQYEKVTSLSSFRTEATASDEREIRVQLAAAYRIFDYLGWTQLIYGHITARIPGPEKHFLINPFGLMFHEVTASNLVKIDLDGNIVGNSAHPVNPAGYVIHSAIHGGRDDVHCVMHTHTVAGMALAALEGGLQNHDFAAISLFDRVAYHDFEGVTVRNDERARLVEALGDKNLLVLRNHGLLSCGGTIAQAFLRLYNLELAARVQVTAQATQLPLLAPQAEVCEAHATTLENSDNGSLAFAALMRLMDQRDPGYRE